MFPLVPRDKVPLLSKAKGGKGLHDATTDAVTIAGWWTQYPDANVGIATGAASGVVVVDVDGEAGEAALAQYGPLPATVESRTGKGRHLLYTGSDVRNSAGKLGPQLDVRGDGGYIVAPPSIHPNGHAYRWATAGTPGPGQAPAYMQFWTLFGTSNQLLAALTLMGVTVWLRRTGRRYWYTLAPMLFVLGVTVSALGLQVLVGVRAAVAAGTTIFVVPILVFTIMLRKHLLRGITFGAVRK